MNMKRKSIFWVGCSDDVFIELVSSVYTYKELSLAFGVYNKGAHNNTLKARISHLGLSVDHFHMYTGIRFERHTRTMEEVLVENSTYNRGSLKKRLLNSELLENRCSLCGLGTTWNGMSITLQLDHINGIYNDNRIGNLRMLCPNCHTQTDTFAGKSIKYVREKSLVLVKHKKLRSLCSCGNPKTSQASVCYSCSMMNRKRVNLPTSDQLVSDVTSLGYVGTGKKYSVSDNAVRKWLRGYNIDPKTVKKHK